MGKQFSDKNSNIAFEVSLVNLALCEEQPKKSQKIVHVTFEN